MTVHPHVSYSETMAYEKPQFPSGLSHPAPYEIRLRGKLDPHWSAWFNSIEITTEATDGGTPITILVCPPIDQAKLRGMLNKIWDLNLILISIHRIEVDDREKLEDD